MIFSRLYAWVLIAFVESESFVDTGFEKGILYKGDIGFADSVVTANYVCNHICPFAVVRPTSVRINKSMYLYLISNNIILYE